MEVEKKKKEFTWSSLPTKPLTSPGPKPRLAPVMKTIIGAIMGSNYSLELYS